MTWRTRGSPPGPDEVTEPAGRETVAVARRARDAGEDRARAGAGQAARVVAAAALTTPAHEVAAARRTPGRGARKVARTVLARRSSPATTGRRSTSRSPARSSTAPSPSS